MLKLLQQYRRPIILGFKTLQALLLLFTINIFYFSLSSLQLSLIASTIGNYFALVAAYLLLFSLLPGITRRLQVLPRLSAAIMPFRRQLGISTYLFGVSHWLLSFVLDQVLLGNFPPANLPQPFIISGLILIFILTPLFLTSNDHSLRLLKKNWKRIHRLVYFGLAFLFFHLSLQQSIHSLPVAAVLFLELASFIKQFLYRK